MWRSEVDHVHGWAGCCESASEILGNDERFCIDCNEPTHVIYVRLFRGDGRA